VRSSPQVRSNIDDRRRVSRHSRQPFPSQGGDAASGAEIQFESEFLLVQWIAT